MNEINTPRTWSCFPCCSLSNTREPNTSQDWGIHVQGAANTAFPPAASAEGPVTTQPGERFLTAVGTIPNRTVASTTAQPAERFQPSAARAFGSCEDIIGSRRVGNVNILATGGIQPDSFIKDFTQRCQDSMFDLAGSHASAVKQRFEQNYGRDILHDFKDYAVVNFIITEYIKRHADVSPEGVRGFEKIKKTFGILLKTDPLNRKSIFSNSRNTENRDKLEKISLSIKQCIELLFNKNDFGPGDFMLQELVLDFILLFHFSKENVDVKQILNRKEMLRFLISPYRASLAKGRDSRINGYSRGDNRGYISVIASDLDYIRNSVAELVLTTTSFREKLAKTSFQDILALGQSVNEQSSAP
ncbi:hypothetical protein ACL2XO_21085 [Sodalis sp. RH15]|uniref:hypothetical protein n=1 Tax=Sodalis sp. RH15 TaxID=3394330 RepID=UPI0039B3B4B3